MMSLKGRISGVFAGLSTAALVVVASAACPRDASAATGRQWLDGDLDAALATAKKANKRLFVKFEASWCGPCKRLGALLEQEEGKRVMGGVLGIRVDFDDPNNRKHIEKYVVLGLPTVMVLGVDGVQVSRIEGYENKESWLAEAQAAKTASDPLPALRNAVAQRPHDGRAVLRLGKALLVRGDAKEGLALLERAGWLAHGAAKDKASVELAAETLFVLGRYHHRVRRDPGTAQHVWRELATRYPASGFAGGAWWWYARSQHELGRDNVAVTALSTRARREPGNMSALMQWGKFVLKHKLADQTKPAIDALAAATVGKSAEDLGKLRALVDQLKALSAPAPGR